MAVTVAMQATGTHTPTSIVLCTRLCHRDEPEHVTRVDGFFLLRLMFGCVNREFVSPVKGNCWCEHFRKINELNSPRAV